MQVRRRRIPVREQGRMWEERKTCLGLPCKRFYGANFVEYSNCLLLSEDGWSLRLFFILLNCLCWICKLFLSLFDICFTRFLIDKSIPIARGDSCRHVSIRVKNSQHFPSSPSLSLSSPLAVISFSSFSPYLSCALTDVALQLRTFKFDLRAFGKISCCN